MNRIGSVVAVSMVPVESAAAAAVTSEGAELPAPFTPFLTDDLMTSLMVGLLRHKHESRVASDQEAQAATRAQAEAHARKIEKMHDLADHTFAQALTQGVASGLGAMASLGGALFEYRGQMNDLAATASKEAAADLAAKAAEEGAAAGAEGATDLAARAARIGAANLAAESKELLRDGRLLSAAGSGVDATGRVLGAFWARDQELDRADMAVEDAAIDRARSSAEAASNESRRQQEDIRETVGAIKQYQASKTALEQAALFRG